MPVSGCIKLFADWRNDGRNLQANPSLTATRLIRRPIVNTITDRQHILTDQI